MSIPLLLLLVLLLLLLLQVRKADGRRVDLTVQRPARYLPSPVVSSMQERGGRQVRCAGKNKHCIVLFLLRRSAFNLRTSCPLRL
jgi:hypothetical protein